MTTDQMTHELTNAQRTFSDDLKAACPAAKVELEIDEYSDDGAATVTLTEDGATQTCWVSPSGLMLGDWL